MNSTKYAYHRLTQALLAALLLLVVACTAHDEPIEPTPVGGQERAVDFGSYVVRTTETRAIEAVGEPMTDLLLRQTGFGVFGYYTGNRSLTPTQWLSDDKVEANFMWNQRVDYQKVQERWYYTPLKYWPNEVPNGTVDDQDNDRADDPATTDNSYGGLMSFFAYAPYRPITDPALPQTAAALSGNAGQQAYRPNDEVGYPYVDYRVAPRMDESEDLLWGVSPGLAYPNAGGGNCRVGIGEPLIDVVKPNTTQRMEFVFRHALSRLFLRVQGVMDAVQRPDSKPLDSDTRIYIERITISLDNMPAEARLSLCNTVPSQPEWLASSVTPQPMSLLTDLTSLHLNPKLDLREYGIDPVNTANTLAEAETTDDIKAFLIAKGLNTDGQKDFSGLPEGVTHTLMPVYDEAEVPGFMFIPWLYRLNDAGDALPQLTVTCRYVVITRDPNLQLEQPKGYSFVVNQIRQTLVPGKLFEAGKMYYLNINLGLTSAKFDVEEVDGWEPCDCYTDDQKRYIYTPPHHYPL